MLRIRRDMSFTLLWPDFVNKLFAVTKKMLKQVKESPFPEHCKQLTLANELGAFFKKKISDICFESDAVATVHNNHSTLATSTNYFQPSSSSEFFSNFELLSKDSVKKLVLSVKSCWIPLLKYNCYYQPVIRVWCLSRRVKKDSCNSHTKEVWFWPGFQNHSPH